MADLEDYEVVMEYEDIIDNIQNIAKKYAGAVALCVAGTYHPETNTIVLAAVCKNTDIPIETKEEVSSPKDKKDLKGPKFNPKDEKVSSEGSPIDEEVTTKPSSMDKKVGSKRSLNDEKVAGKSTPMGPTPRNKKASAKRSSKGKNALPNDKKAGAKSTPRDKKVDP